MTDELAVLLRDFEPNNDRYVSYQLQVRTEFFKKRYITVTEIAWLVSISSGGKIDNPLDITDYSRLSPFVWLTNDKKLVVRRGYPGEYLIVYPEKLTEQERELLVTGLAGDFESMDREFETRRREFLTSQVDSIIEKLRRESNMWKLSRINLENPQFPRLRKQLLSSLLA